MKLINRQKIIIIIAIAREDDAWILNAYNKLESFLQTQAAKPREDDDLIRSIDHGKNHMMSKEWSTVTHEQSETRRTIK